MAGGKSLSGILTGRAGRSDRPADNRNPFFMSEAERSDLREIALIAGFLLLTNIAVVGAVLSFISAGLPR